MIGATIGRFKVESQIGSGGMGVVYSAVDSETNQPAALKVLSIASAADPERRKRFLAEAKTAAALNHPNIVKIHDSGTFEWNGQQTQYIAMERVEGETLDRLIQRGLTHQQALDYGLQVASALDAAHRAGVVHRDLKPANIMVSPAGHVKVLDFGLAKVMLDTAEATAETVSVRTALTIDGTIVGTVSYMSPEQAEGKPVDARSDIFSFGAVLYEMISGRRAFPGESRIATLSAVLLKEPAPLETDPALFDLIQRCLRKDPAARYQSILDVQTELSRIRSRGKRATAGWSRRTGLAAIGGAAAGLAGGMILGPRWIRPPSPALSRLTFRRGDVMNAQFGPGGSVIYSGAWDGQPARLFVAQPGVREARPLDLPPAEIASVSPGGEMLILTGVSGAWTLSRVPIAGGAPRPIYEEVAGAGWSPTGDSIAVVRRVGGSHQLEYPAGRARASMYRAALNPRVSPDGTKVAVVETERYLGDYSVAVYDVSRNAGRRVVSEGWRMLGGMEWSPDGTEIWMGGARPGGSPVLSGIRLNGTERVVYRWPGWLQIYDAGSDGGLLLGPINSRLGIIFGSPSGQGDREMSWLDGSRAYGLSDDGKLLLFSELSDGESRNPALYVRKTDGSAAIRIGTGFRASLSDDGRWVVCVRHQSGTNRLTILPVGTGTEQIVETRGIQVDSAHMMPDGARLLVSGSEGTKPARTWLVPLNGGPQNTLTPEGTVADRLRPDGKAALGVQAGKLALWPLDGGPPRQVGELKPGEVVVRWRGDGQSVLLSQSRFWQQSMEVVRLDLASGQRTLVLQRKPPSEGAVFWGQPFVSADGTHFAMSYRTDSSDLYLAKGIV